MRATIAKSVSQLSKRAVTKPNRAMRMQVYTSSSFPISTVWEELQEANYLSSQEDSYYSSFENTLERVLEMNQLGKEESIHWEKAVRSVIQGDDYHSQQTVCHICGGNKSTDELCHRCVSVNCLSARAKHIPESPSFQR